MKNNGLKNAKAITLIAMVVTIIVLLILAGVSIAVLTGENGLLNRATTAKQTHEEKTEEEKLKLGVLALSTEYRSQTTHAADEDKFSKFVNKEANKTKLANELGVATSAIEIDTAKDILTYRGKTYTLDSLGGITDLMPSSYVAEDISMVGQYADIDEDGTIDGIIFADLAVGNQNTSGSNGKGCGLGFEYSIPVEIGLKKYVTAKTNEENPREYLIATSTGKDRFYVVALGNASDSKKTWYSNAYNHMDASDTSTDFGTGKTNSKTIIQRATEATSSTGYRTLSSGDMWYLLTGDITDWTTDMKNWWTTSGYQATKDHSDLGWSDLLKKGWFVPSKGELAAINGELGNSYLSSVGLTNTYWSSSQDDACSVWDAYFDSNSPYYGFQRGAVYGSHSFYVRLTTTF